MIGPASDSLFVHSFWKECVSWYLLVTYLNYEANSAVLVVRLFRSLLFYYISTNYEKEIFGIINLFLSFFQM